MKAAFNLAPPNKAVELTAGSVRSPRQLTASDRRQSRRLHGVNVNGEYAEVFQVYRAVA